MSALLATVLVSMSVEALSWAFRHSKSRLGTRLVLLALADFAQADGGDAFPSVATLAAKAGVSPRAARSALRRLEQMGEIVRTGTSRRGTTVYALRLEGAANSAGAAESGTEGPQKTTAAVSSTSANPSVNPSEEPSSSSTARKPAFEEEDLPGDFPEHLRPALEAAWPVIGRIAEAKGGHVPPTRAAVARAIASYPDRDHLDAATDLEQWLVYGTGRRNQVPDVVQSYRRALSDRRPRETGEARRPSGRGADSQRQRRDLSRYDEVMHR